MRLLRIYGLLKRNDLQQDAQGGEYEGDHKHAHEHQQSRHHPPIESRAFVDWRWAFGLRFFCSGQVHSSGIGLPRSLAPQA